MYDPATAESWDAVGLVCGDPEAPVRRVLFAVDPVQPVADEALGWGADLVVTHHPLFLRGVSSVAATTPKGRLVSSLIRAGVAMHCIHTNADRADQGVSDALAGVLGLTRLRPLAPADEPALDYLATYVPVAEADSLIDALTAAGAARMGDYQRAVWTVEGVGTFEPLPGANPTIGAVGRREKVPETKIETVLPRHRRAEVVAALRAAHSYEEPAFQVLEMAPSAGRTGLGRIGTLPAAEPLGSFVRRVAAALPRTAGGVRATGDPDRLVSTVAVCGGAGDNLLATAARAGVDAYVTADLRHHPAAEATGPALVDAAHWATEWPWLADAAARLEQAMSGRGTTVETKISRVVTDPWTLHAT